VAEAEVQPKAAGVVAAMAAMLATFLSLLETSYGAQQD
jgi:hypothetical protein